MREKFVVDCSVAAKWVLPEPGGLPALRLLAQEQTGEISLIAPDLLLVELASLLAKKARRKQVSNAQARESFRIIELSVLLFFETRPLLAPALDLAIHSHISLWDCVYLALAIEHECAIVTADHRLLRGHSSRHPSIRLLA